MILEPPAQYLPYDGPLEVRRMLPQEVGRECRKLGFHWVYGCKTWYDGKCVIYVPTIDDGAIERHERAHCNGWSGNHPR